ncbi:hypothetical protein FQN49_000032 [Arthroderma sp. PD_2]|nr:hypothetical protein FQN49_000032 [Arthroderma sp. PD_2]
MAGTIQRQMLDYMVATWQPAPKAPSHKMDPKRQAPPPGGPATPSTTTTSSSTPSGASTTSPVSSSGEGNSMTSPVITTSSSTNTTMSSTIFATHSLTTTSPVSSNGGGNSMTSPVITTSGSTNTTMSSTTSATHSLTTTSTKPGHTAGSSSGSSSGVLAGAVVGSFIGGAILTLLAVYLFFGRRRSRENGHKDNRTQGTAESKGYDTEPNGSRDHFGGPLTLSSTPDKLSTHFAHPLPGEKASLGGYIPRPADDKTVHNRVLTVFEHIALHVENYYSCSSSLNIESSLSAEDAAMIDSYNSPFLPVPVISLLSQSKDQGPVIKHCLIQAILPLISNATQSTSIPEGDSFLPPLYAASKDLRDMELYTDSVATQVQFQWRMLTSHGYRGVSAAQRQAYLTSRKEKISSVAKRFTTTFRFHANPQHPESVRTRHLASMMEDAADLGVWLFEQPCGFEFIWDDAVVGKITVYPAMEKTHDEQGRRLQVKQNMVKADTIYYM